MSAHLLLIEDDEVFARRLRKSLEDYGMTVTHRTGLSAANDVLESCVQKGVLPKYAIIDMRLSDGNGLDMVKTLRCANSDIRIVILTAYGNLASAVAAIKTGAVDFLAKPANIEDIVAALQIEDVQIPRIPETPMSIDRLRWEHILHTYEQCDRNISKTARSLKMHRRTLQRILAKRSPK